MPEYALTPHTFLCVSGEYVVVLDLKKDRYLALELDRARRLTGLVSGWQHLCAPDIGELPEQQADLELLEDLLQQELITRDASTGKDETLVEIAKPVGELNGDAWNGAFRTDSRAVIRFLRATLVAAALLRYQPLHRVIGRVKRRVRARNVEIDAHEVSRLITTFDRLRPFAFAGRDACLFEAIALAEFLGSYGRYPNVVFGVRTAPFAAHCWLQQDGFVLNDTVDRVREYVPVMVV